MRIDRINALGGGRIAPIEVQTAAEAQTVYVCAPMSA
jgi:hypothetical protein